MDNTESGQFLLKVVDSADDMNLFLKSYNACTADEVLRNGVTYDDRPLVIYGSVKRQGMCRKFLPRKLSEVKRSDLLSKVIYLTEESIRGFVNDALEQLKGSGALTLPQTPEQEVSEEVEAPASDVLDAGDTVTSEETEEGGEQGVENEEPALVENKTLDQPTTVATTRCNYGVPVIQLEYISPDVIGLKESLFVNVEQEDLANFFDLVKGKVLTSISSITREE